MTRCEQISEELKAYLDGELPLDRRLAIRLHLSRCAPCREEISIMDNISHELRADEPNGFDSALRNRLLSVATNVKDSPPEPDSAPLWKRRPLEFLLAGGAAVIVAIILFPVFAQSREFARFDRSAATGQDANKALQAGSSPDVVASVPSAAIMGHQSAQGVGGAGALRQPASAGMSGEARPVFKSRVGAATYADGHQANAAAELPVARNVIRNASISVSVTGLEEKGEAVEGMVKSAGGFVVSNQLSTGGEGVRSASLVVRVPVQKFDGFLKSISKLGEVTAKSVTGQDVTEKMSDEDQAVTVLRQELSDTRERIRKFGDDNWQYREDERQTKIRLAQVEGRLELMRKLAALGKVEITLTERPKTAIKSGGFLVEMGDTGRAAVNSFLNAARIPVLLLIWVLAYAPIWIPLAIVFRYAARAHRKHLAVREARAWRGQREGAAM